MNLDWDTIRFETTWGAGPEHPTTVTLTHIPTGATGSGVSKYYFEALYWATLNLRTTLKNLGDTNGPQR